MSYEEDRVIVRCTRCNNRFVSKLPEPFRCPDCGEENFIKEKGESHKIDQRHVV